MKIRTISDTQWKIVFCTALLLFGAVWAAAVANWRTLLVPGAGAHLQLQVDQRIGHVATVEDVDAASPLARLGVKAGDKITFDNLSDSSRGLFPAGEPVGMTIGEGAARRHVMVEPVTLKEADRAIATFYVAVIANALVALVLAALIGLRRASSVSARILALILLVETAFASQFMSGGPLMDFALVVLWPWIAFIAYAGFFLFSCRFPDDETGRVPAWIRWTALPLILYMAVMAVLRTAARHGADVPFTGSVTGNFVTVALIVLLSSINLWQAYRRSSGAARQRMQWVGMAIFVRYAAQVVAAIPGWSFTDTNAFGLGQLGLTIFANIVLAYGILRHRLLDVGLAVNRALVYGIVSVVLLVSFGLLEWLAHHFVSPEEAENNAYLDAGIALGLYLVFHKLRHYVDHAVERLFFHHWHENEARLRRFVAQAAHITQADALVEATLAALQRFTGNAGCALYRLDGDGYRCIGDAGMAAPRLAGVDDPLAVALRAEMAPVVPGEYGSALPGALALPMRFRGGVQGFVLLGQKSSQTAYRPDEVAVLDHAANQVGLDLQALQAEKLQAEVAGLQRELDILGKALALNNTARAA